ncbi:uncharacterized protein LOC131308326 [Rhododendron vialii]|uniref:uncharacterized protein LOC131308326 n=1 Tax=Rhododendron vialii TaxID=182163 RepID=UPI00265E42B6|nr:uncharacterized protein LOC131308326 [Rhododendron vialii]
MPTFTRIAWETLLEPTVHKNPSDSPPRATARPSSLTDDGSNHKRAQAPNHIYISPALYITPAPAPIPDSSYDPVSPSPYVVNHKRRGRDAVVRARDDEKNLNLNSNLDVDLSSSGDCGEVVVGEVVEENLFGEEFVGGEGDDLNGGCDEVVDDDFLDPRCEAASVGSTTEVVEECGRQVAECRSVVSNQGEFFDADEEFSSDGSISNLSSTYGPKIESELRAARLSLLEEIERRKTAEHAVTQMYSQWQRLASLLSQTGLTFPSPPNATSTQLEIDVLEQCCQELEVTRFVAEAIGRGQARAEAEIAAELIIESKDQEISRLRDKLQYYEAVNHEMSQRNQEVMEVARRQRQKRQNRRKWIWGCIGLSVAMGTSVIAYSYLPNTSTHNALPTSSGSSDDSHINPAESDLSNK